ncbi:uncharacterized protein L3040_005584 [Drepanopeziza brunnea f. sp. 'multigermtubi']|uniref:Putative integral membrane protein n=1 Tax=Marssonina brunnea f. sp. multigermtubi (strain MB_m1) TaxID=1072389 RepID=K1WYU0_MARBU|nr:putative integral membrane protein [Drepanopeziza brunnea f. sp. 'multigermtubi' MB_m1]EKD13798.1 putative integral membrane protein [Drepanopeziza brunnea f. sp. 'multigermtubi' MB_m1]KAJ5041027.1 hypothetical protein L3040_005584 [Drepanopeziza brunnea f. sp. 'multigermtubi']
MSSTLAARRKQPKENDGVLEPEQDSERTITPTYRPGVNIKEATKTRKTFIIVTSVLYAISVIFLILVLIGNINNKPVIRSTYFYKLDLTNIIPSSAENIVLVNSLARSLGLHDFYQVGLWNFCEGYNDEGITYCHPRESLYWFNPVEVLLNELFSGATIAIPVQLVNILQLIRIASRIMFGFFLAGTCMNVVSTGLVFAALRSRWWSLVLTIWTLVAGIMILAASVIGTAMALIFRRVATSQNELNIGAAYGEVMFAFIWIATGCSVIAFLLHAGMMCCCASRRDVETGRRMGRKSAYGNVGMDERKRPLRLRQWAKLPKWGRRKAEADIL